MKKLFIILLLTPLSILGYSQPDTVYFDNGNIQAIGKYTDKVKTGIWKTYFENGEIESVGSYVEGMLSGKWKWYYENGQQCSIEKYRNDDFKKGKFWDEQGNRTSSEGFIKEAEYPGGFDAFINIFNRNLVYPPIARETGIEGTVKIQFNVNNEGDLVNEKVIKSIDPLLDEEVLRVIKLSEKWTPRIIHGYNANSTFTIPIEFKLN